MHPPSPHPEKKVTPLFPSNPPLILRSCQPPPLPLFENWVGGSALPPCRKGSGSGGGCTLCGLNTLGPIRQQNDKVSIVGQGNLTQFDIKIDHGYCGPNNLTQLGSKKISFRLWVKSTWPILSSIIKCPIWWLSLYTFLLIYFYTFLYTYIQGTLLVTSPKLNTYYSV